MKKFTFLLLLVLLINPAFADDPILQGLVSFDWANKTQLDRDKNIEDIKNIIYKEISKKFIKTNI